MLSFVSHSQTRNIRTKQIKQESPKLRMEDIYTDGSCLGNPGRGGWAVAGAGIKLSGGQAGTTNNIMEMTAVVHALEQCLVRDILEIRLFTDSNYVKNGITLWIKNWKRNGWRTATGAPVKNKDLWIQIDTLAQRMKRVEWHWVKAHNGHPQNELVDSLAREEAKKNVTPLYNGSNCEFTR
jgi:ribonuclease HI